MRSERTESLYGYLCEQSGKKILLAQQESPVPGKSEQEMDFLKACTGELPVIRGLDFMHDDFAGCVERAKRWDEQGGIVSVCWHTGVAGKGYDECKAEEPDFGELLREGSDAHQRYEARLEEAAKALRELMKDDIPVLWRPYHEFDGGWFWWGKGGADIFIRLWRWMHDYFMREQGLTNLLWVLGYADDVLPGWYPGDAYCDITGSDTYRGVTTHAASYKKLRELGEIKPLAFHECGVFPDPEDFFRDGAVWSWVMPWHGKWLMEDNTKEQINKVYQDERMVTLSRKGW